MSVMVMLLTTSALPLSPERLLEPEPRSMTATYQPRNPSISFGKVAMQFEPNTGQLDLDPSVRFMAHASGSTLFFTPAEVVLSLPNARPAAMTPDAVGFGLPASHSAAWVSLVQSRSPMSPSLPQVSPPSVVRLHFEGANPSVAVESGAPLAGKVNYLLGNDPHKWRTGIPTYSGITYRDLYPGIDLSYSGGAGSAGGAGHLKGTYTLAPGADPSLIKWRYQTPSPSSTTVAVDEAGNLQVRMSSDSENGRESPITLTEQAPTAWQQIEGRGQVMVSARYVVDENGSISFSLGSYDPTLPLTIDPFLTYSTYLGGSDTEVGHGIGVDRYGNTYVAGVTWSFDFPLANPFQTKGSISSAPATTTLTATAPFTATTRARAFISKFNPSGTALLYSTYLGGSGDDLGESMAVDADGNVYVTGIAYSADFPTTPGAYQRARRGTQDVFVSKLDPTGSALLYSTYLGGDGGDRGYGIAVDAAGNAYVTGDTGSTDFPLQNPYQSTHRNLFVTKLNPAGTALVYSTYIGGSGYDAVTGIAVDGQGHVSITGGTDSTDYPTVNPLQLYQGGGPGPYPPFDGFVTKFSPSGSSLIFSTYLCGDEYDVALGIASDEAGNVYVTGGTFSGNFPITSGAYQPNKASPIDVYITKFNPEGTAYVYSTYLGGSTGTEYGYGIAVDTEGNAYITGRTASTDFPVRDPVQPYNAGGDNTFITKLNPQGSALVYSTYLGSSDTNIPGDQGTGIAVDSEGNTYVIGNTAATDFPTVNAVQPNFGGGQDAFVAKLTYSCILSFSDVPPGSTFYPYVQCLACHGIVSGYSSGAISTGTPNGTSDDASRDVPESTFRPDNPVSRGQLAKIVSSSASLRGTPTTQTFEDVPPGSTFYLYIERMASRGIIAGYPCGGEGEACVSPGNRPYFRPGSSATRAQISKIVSNSAGYEDTPGSQTFEDVPPASQFYVWIERLAERGTMSGYSCGGAGEPCVGPQNRKYFRPNSTATREQTSKIVSNTFFVACGTSGATPLKP